MVLFSMTLSDLIHIYNSYRSR